jgi:hypothetical protein
VTDTDDRYMQEFASVSDFTYGEERAPNEIP